MAHKMKITYAIAAVHEWFFVELENISLSFRHTSLYIAFFPSLPTSITGQTAEVCMCFLFLSFTALFSFI